MIAPDVQRFEASQLCDHLHACVINLTAHDQRLQRQVRELRKAAPGDPCPEEVEDFQAGERSQSPETFIRDAGSIELKSWCRVCTFTSMSWGVVPELLMSARFHRAHMSTVQA